MTLRTSKCTWTGLILILAACTSEQPARTQSDDWLVRDSGGIRIAESREPLWPAASGRKVDSIPELVVGAVEGDEAYLFTYIRQAVRLPDGAIAVVDRGDYAIRLYSAAGVHAATLGRRGGGPGEFQADPTLAWLEGDTLLAWDPRALRLTWFERSGAVVRTLSLQSVVSGLRIPLISGGSVWRANANGTLLNTAGSFEEDPATGTLTLSRPVLIDAATQTAVNLPEFQHSRGASVRRSDGMLIGLTRPFDHQLRAVLGRDEVAIADKPYWQVTFHDLSGAPRRVVRAAVPRFAVTATMRADAEARTASSTRLPGDVVARVMADLGAPDSLPAIGELHLTRDGHLLARRPAAAGAGPSTTWDVVDPDGRWLGTIVLPVTAGRVLDWGDDYVITAAADALDIQRLHLYRIRHP